MEKIKTSNVMRKLFLSLLIMLVVLSLTGCSEKELPAENSQPGVASESISETSEISEVSEVSEISEVSEVSEVSEISEVEEPTETPTPEPEPTEEPEDDDPFGLFKVSESFAKNHGGSYLKKDEKLYTMSQVVPLENAEKYEVGWKKFTDNTAWVYNIPTTSGYTFSFGDFGELEINGNDEIISYKNDWIELYSAEFIGYTVPMWDDDAAKNIVYDYNEDTMRVSRHIINDFEVKDQNNNIVDNHYGLALGQTYTISWHVGTDYHEYELTANCKYYYTGGQRADYTLKGEVNKEGFATYDFSEIPPGLYFVWSGMSTASRGFIRII